MLRMSAGRQVEHAPTAGRPELSSPLLESYVEKFYGFGDWDAPIWFIGIEEAGAREFADVERWLSAWDARGQACLEDAPAFYHACGNARWHGAGASPQPTWRQLIRMLLLLRGEPDKDAAILDCQRSHWGAATEVTCLAELLPLPCPSTAEWPYAEWSDLPWLQTRKSYVSRVRARRENELRRRIQEHGPREDRGPVVVIFYGLELPGGVSLLPSWSSIAGGPFEQVFSNKKILLRRQAAGTTFYVTRHPVAEADEHFRQIGELTPALLARPFKGES